jgi:hypothetical protein
VTACHDRKAKCKHAWLAAHWGISRLTLILTHRGPTWPLACEVVGCCLYSDWLD